MNDLVCVRTFSSRSEAEVARGILQASGIQAMVAADDAGGWRPEVALSTGGARLLVDAGQAEAAAEMLRVHEPPELAAQRKALAARLRGCMAPAIAAPVLFVLGAFVGNYVAPWLGNVLFGVAAVLLVLAVVRGTRAA